MVEDFENNKEAKVKSVCRVSLLVLVVAALSTSSWAQGAGAVRIDVAGQGDPRVIVAVPSFAATPGLEAVAREMAETVAYDLMFSGIFRLLPPSSFPASFTGFTEQYQNIDFNAWSATHAEYLVYAWVTQIGDNIIAECRLFDSIGTGVMGKRFEAGKAFHRLIAHRYSEEIIRQTEGVPGIGTSRICFSAGASGKKEIYIADYDGANAKQVTQHGSISIKPKFSPDGAKIAYLSYKDRYPFLYVLDLATGTSTPLSKNVGLNAAPAWSPDGKKIALVLSKDANNEIYIKNVDGSGEVRVTNDSASDAQPTFSPDGSQIAFVSDRGGKPQIYGMNIDGSNVRRLSYQGGSAYDPVWSPDGKHIAYVANRPGEGFEIYMMETGSQNWERLTNSSGTNESPSWSADSRHIIFSSSRSGRSELWVVNANPPHEEHRIVIGDLRCEGPTWGPRR